MTQERKKGKGATIGGDTGLPARQLYYCGRKLGKKCRCGKCGNICGPEGGCPCDSCVELVGFLVNKEGSLCKKGKGYIPISGGDTFIPSKDLYYCGKVRNECRCGNCPNEGRCGPIAGCPCNSCVVLVPGLKINGDGKLCRKGVQWMPGVLQKCSCKHCSQALLKGATVGKIPENLVKIASSSSAKKPIPPISKSSTRFNYEFKPPTKQFGPEDYTFKPTAPPEEAFTSFPTPSTKDNNNENNKCVICLELDKEFVLIPCGHYSYCHNCVSSITQCAICRAEIVSRIRIYES